MTSSMTGGRDACCLAWLYLTAFLRTSLLRATVADAKGTGQGVTMPSYVLHGTSLRSDSHEFPSAFIVLSVSSLLGTVPLCLDRLVLHAHLFRLILAFTRFLILCSHSRSCSSHPLYVPTPSHGRSYSCTLRLISRVTVIALDLFDNFLQVIGTVCGDYHCADYNSTDTEV